jgi:enoyl-[acyl-carrier protein] reductase II
MGGNLETAGVDPSKEFYPAGQGVGGIKELIPAGDIVHSMVAEAEEILAKPKTLVG